MVETNVKRRAVIDLGTNTFNLLIAEVGPGGLKVIYHDKKPVLLGMGGINEGQIANDALKRARETLILFQEKCIELRVVELFAIGTSALRGASNRHALLDFALNQLGMYIRVITGQDEARYIYQGVRISHPFEHTGLIMDIGGGSTEFIRADKQGLQWGESFEIGVSRLYQAMGQPDEFTPEHMEHIRNYLDTHCGAAIAEFRADELIGSSGTFETLYDIMSQEDFPDVDHSLELDIEQLKNVLTWSMRSTLQERMDNPWIVPIRKKMLPVSAMKVLWALEKSGAKRIFVSPYSLKEGVLVEA